MNKRKIIIIGIISLILLSIIIAGIVAVFISPKVDVTDISVICADRFYSGERYEPEQEVLSMIQSILQLANEESEISCQALSGTSVIPSQRMSDYSIVVIKMTVIGRSLWSGYIPYALIDDFEDLSNILLVTIPQPFGSNIDRFNSEEEIEFRLYICSGDKTEEEIASALKSILIQIPYTNRVHPHGSVYASCKDAEITFQ